MVQARRIALLLLGYSAVCGQAFVLRPRLTAGHVTNSRKSGLVRISQRHPRARRILGPVLAAEGANDVDEVDEGSRSELGTASVEKPWDVRVAGVAATVAAVVVAAGLLHPALANAADALGESCRRLCRSPLRLVLFLETWNMCFIAYRRQEIAPPALCPPVQREGRYLNLELPRTSSKIEYLPAWKYLTGLVYQVCSSLLLTINKSSSIKS